MWFDDPLLDDLDDELDLSTEPQCKSFLHKNGYTIVSICNSKYPSR